MTKYYTYSTGKKPPEFLRNGLDASSYINCSQHEWEWTQEQQEDMAASVEYLWKELSRAKEILAFALNKNTYLYGVREESLKFLTSTFIPNPQPNNTQPTGNNPTP